MASGTKSCITGNTFSVTKAVANPAPEVIAAFVVSAMEPAFPFDPQQKMDIFLPKGRSSESTKMFIWIHGGAWAAGDKSEGAGIKGLLDPYLDNYAYASLNYRLYNTTTYANKFPAQEDDIKSAVEYILSQAEKWKISNRIVIGGQSAGGHLALLQAYKYNTSGNIKAVVAYYPPTELTAMYNFSAFTQLTLYSLLGGDPSMVSGLYDSSSPLTYLNSGSVPSIFFHGTVDDVVPIAQSDLLKAKLIQVGVPHDYMYIQGEGHGFTEASVLQTVVKATDFVNVYVP
jgi:acetyl esterase/lipase